MLSIQDGPRPMLRQPWNPGIAETHFAEPDFNSGHAVRFRCLQDASLPGDDDRNRLVGLC